MSLFSSISLKVGEMPRWLRGYYSALLIALVVVAVTFYSKWETDNVVEDLLRADAAWDPWFAAADSLQRETVQFMLTAESIMEENPTPSTMIVYRRQQDSVVALCGAIKQFPRETPFDDYEADFDRMVASTLEDANVILAEIDSTLYTRRSSFEENELAELYTEARLSDLLSSLDVLKARARAIHIASLTRQSNHLKRRNQLDAVLNLLAFIALIASSAYGTVVANRLTSSERARYLQLRQLQESEELLLTMTAGLPAVVYQAKMTPDGKFTFPFMSNAVEGLLSHVPEELHEDGTTIFQNVHKEDLEALLESIQESYSQLTPWNRDFRIIGKQGGKWIRGSSLPTRQDDGSVVWNGVLIDVSAEKQAKAELELSEERYRFLIENQGDGLLVTDLNETFIYCNPAATRMLGYSRKELVGMTLRDIIPPDDLVHHAPILKNIMRGERAQVRVRVIRQDGEMRTVDVAIAPRLIDGKLIGSFGVMRDVTEQLAAETALRESESRFQTIFRDLRIGMVTINLDGTFRDTNRAFQQFIGRSADELVGTPAADVCHSDVRESVRSEIRKLIETRGSKPIHMEYRFVHANGTLKWGQVSATAFTDASGKANYLIAMIENITERKQIERRVEESESLYRHLFESATDGYLLLAHQIVDCNNQAAEILGYSREELIGMNPYDASPVYQPNGEPSAVAAKELIKRAMEGRPQRFFWKHKRKDGELVDAEIMMKQITVRGEKLLLAGMRDITERLQQEREIRENLIKIDTLINSAVDGIIAFDEEGRIEIFNPAAAQIFEHSEEEALGSDFFHLIAEQEAIAFKANLLDKNRPHRTTVGLSNEELIGIRRRSGQLFPLALAVNPMLIEKELKFVAIARDITSRKLSEQRIVENESKLKAILDSAAEGIVVIDDAGCILNFNRAAERIFGARLAKRKCNSILEFVPSLDLESLTSKHGSSSFETKGLRRDEGEFPIQVSHSTVAFNDKVHITLIIRDKTFENEQRDKMIESDKYVSIGTLAAGIAHEFKNYLAGIIGHASFARDYLDDDDGTKNAREAFDQIIEIGEKANEVAVSLLTYSRKSNDGLELVNLNDLILATLKFGRSELRGDNIEIVEKLDAVQRVRANANQLQQVIFNLMLNARHAMPGSGVMTIITRDDGDFVEMRVGDTGVGIEPSDLKRIFDPFFSTKGVWGGSKIQGTGLGLSICRNILTRFGADISVKSRVGVGTTFTIRIPVGTEIEPSIPLPADLKDVVVVSIDSALLEHTHISFEACDINVFSAADVEEFERIAAEIEPDSSLTLVDIFGLHPIDSAHVIEQLKADKLNALIISRPDVELPEYVQNSGYSICNSALPPLEALVEAFARNRHSVGQSPISTI